MKSSNKHIGPWLAFTPEWFARWQNVLLWLLNAPGVRLWFRWILRIHKDIPITERVVGIGPNYFTYGEQWLPDGRLQRTTDFRTHVKFAKRLYFAFRPLWWCLHFWDWLIADRFIPELSFGFLTLTAYPAAGAASPVDGYAGRNGVNESFATIQGGAGTEADATLTTNDCILIATSTSNQYLRLWRVILCFETSPPLVTSDSISAAVLSPFTDIAANGLGSPDFHICASTPASTSNVVSGDYTQLGNTSFGSVSYATFAAAGGYTDITLDANGRANVSKTGISQFGARLSWDINNSFTGAWSGDALSRLRFVSADQPGTSADPKLVVTYTNSATGPSRLPLLGVG